MVGYHLLEILELIKQQENILLLLIQMILLVKRWSHIFLHLQKNNDCDIAISTHNIIRGEKVWKSYNLSGDVKMTPKRCIEKLLYDDGVDTSAWAKLYKLKLFNGVRYPVGKLYEDIATTYKIFLKANAIISGNNCIYNYVLRSNSIVNGEFNEKKFDLIEMTDEMVKAVCEVYNGTMN